MFVPILNILTDCGLLPVSYSYLRFAKNRELSQLTFWFKGRNDELFFLVSAARLTAASASVVSVSVFHQLACHQSTCRMLSALLCALLMFRWIRVPILKRKTTLNIKCAVVFAFIMLHHFAALKRNPIRAAKLPFYNGVWKQSALIQVLSDSTEHFMIHKGLSKTVSSIYRGSSATTRGVMNTRWCELDKGPTIHRQCTYVYTSVHERGGVRWRLAGGRLPSPLTFCTCFLWEEPGLPLDSSSRHR